MPQFVGQMQNLRKLSGKLSRLPYWIVTDTVVVCVITPAVPVTMTVPLSAAGSRVILAPDPLPLLPSPQLTAAIDKAVSATAARRARLRGQSKKSNTNPATAAAIPHAISVNRGQGAAPAEDPEATVSVAVPDPETVPGIEQVVFASVLLTLQVKLTEAAKPADGATVIVADAEAPWLSVKLRGFAATVKPRFHSRSRL